MAHRMPAFVEVTSRVRIPAAEIELAFAASGGPGGQNVNKVASKAILRWNPVGSAALSDADRNWVLSRLGPRLTTNGDLVLTCDRHRDQPRNVAEVLERLRDLLRQALLRPVVRKKTRLPRAARERRLSEKRRRSERKRSRRPGTED